MKNIIVRISSVLIRGFKNVSYGEISFDTTNQKHKACILGLYGQNGSGKTALIDSLALLKYALRGAMIPQVVLRKLEPCRWSRCVRQICSPG